MSAMLLLNKSNSVVDGLGRPIAPGLTVAEVGAWLSAHDADLPAYVVARFSIVNEAPVSVEQQLRAKERRLRAIAKASGRVLSRIQQVNGVIYEGLLAR